MYCSNCGSLVNNDAKFCPACGAQQAPAIAASPASPAQTATCASAQPLAQDVSCSDSPATCPSCGCHSTVLIKTTNWLKQYWWVIAAFILIALGAIGSINSTPSGAHILNANHAAARTLIFGSIAAIGAIAGFMKRHKIEKRQCTSCGHSFTLKQLQSK